MFRKMSITLLAFLTVAVAVGCSSSDQGAIDKAVSATVAAAISATSTTKSIISTAVAATATAAITPTAKPAAAVAKAAPALDAIQMTLPDSVFTADDVAAAGWKKSKELSSKTLPGATSVWYGFYQQRDVEVRVYESQDEAISVGQELADLHTGRISGPRTSYLSYAIVGNLILLCEKKIEDCQSLLDGIGQ